MKRSLIFVPILLLLQQTTVHGQNLLANGSFEEENLCTEYHKYCAPEAWTATSGSANYYFREPKNAFDGYHYVGLTAGSLTKTGVRNFIRSQLLCGLRKGHLYQVEFYVCASNKILDSIGVYFSEKDYLYEKRSFKSIQPAYWYKQKENANPAPWAWQKLSFVYTATGNETYMVIGSFKRNDFRGITKPDFVDDYYFFLDKASVTPMDGNEVLCPQAESEKRSLYNDNDRHERVEKRIADYQKNPTDRPRLALTRIPLTLHIDTLIIPDIFFVTASYELSQKSFSVLDSFAMKIKGELDSIVIKGHTDSIGDLEYNRELSLNRAVSVKQYIMSKISVLGVPVSARGYAYWQPVASNRSQSGRKKNRRVEIFVYRKD